jgi:chromosomal replication initiation ATPase DnaA
LGSDSYKQWVKEKFKHLSYQDEIPSSRDLAPTADYIISIVCEHFKVKKENLAVSKRGIANLPRDVAIYFVRLPLSGNIFRSVSTAQSAVRLRELKPGRTKTEHCESIWNKSQQH